MYHHSHGLWTWRWLLIPSLFLSPASSIRLDFLWHNELKILQPDDGVVIQGQPLVNFTNGQFNHVPFTLGNVQNEALMFIFAAFPDPVGVAEYEAFITLIFRREAPRIIKHFPVPNFMVR